jgi:hypothetical protein
VIGEVRLGRDGCAHIGVRRLLVRPIAEAEVRRDRDREQDPDDDDDNEQLDEREALFASEPPAQTIHAVLVG